MRTWAGGDSSLARPPRPRLPARSQGKSTGLSDTRLRNKKKKKNGNMSIPPKED